MDNRYKKPKLYKQWWLALAGGVLLLAVTTAFIARSLPAVSPLRWCLQSSLIIIAVLISLRRNIDLNRREENGTLNPCLGAATWITLSRGGLIALLAGFWLQPWPGHHTSGAWFVWLPGTIYLAAVLGDVLDGWVARKTANETLLGESLDTRVDALGILTASLVAVGYGQLPGFYISAGLAWYLVQLAVWLRKKTGRACGKVKPRKSARFMAGLQMAFLGVVLLPLIAPPATHVAAIFILVPFLAGFVIDWQMVCRHENSD